MVKIVGCHFGKCVQNCAELVWQERCKYKYTDIETTDKNPSFWLSWTEIVVY